MNVLIARLKLWMHGAWTHRTKTLGSLFALAGYVQNHYAQSGIHLPPRYEGILLSGAGVVTFALGLYNWLQTPPPASD